MTQHAQFVAFKHAQLKLIKNNKVKEFKILTLKNLIREESSTSVRRGNLSYTNELVNKYIGENKLYSKEIIYCILSALRAKYSIAAAEFAGKLAKAWTKLQSRILCWFISVMMLVRKFLKKMQGNLSRGFGFNGFDKQIYPRHKLIKGIHYELNTFTR